MISEVCSALRGKQADEISGRAGMIQAGRLKPSDVAQSAEIIKDESDFVWHGDNGGHGSHPEPARLRLCGLRLCGRYCPCIALVRWTDLSVLLTAGTFAPAATFP